LTKCTVLQNDVPVLSDAYLQLVSVNKIQTTDSYEQTVEYEVLVKDAKADFFTKIDNGLLEDIDLSYLDHTYSAANVVASFNNTVADGFMYPLGQSADNVYPLSECRPAVYAKVYWDKIHELAGFTYDWSTLQDGYFDKLVIPYNGDTPIIDYSDYLVDADYVNAETISQPSNGTNVSGETAVLTGWTENEDNQNLFNPTTGEYSVPFYVAAGQSVNIQIDAQVAFGLFNTSGGTAYLNGGALENYRYRPKFRVFKNGVVVSQNFFPFIQYLQTTASTLNTNNNVLGNASIVCTLPISNLLPTDVLTIKGYVEVVSNGSPVWEDAPSAGNPVQVDFEFDVTDMNVRIIPSSNILEFGSTIPINSFVPRQVKQKDFVKSICQMYNLYVEADENNPQRLIYRHRDDYYDSGAVKDWTLKLAKDRQQVLQFLPELSAKKLQLTYKPDKDQPNVLYEDNVREVYGQAEYIFDNEYVKGVDRKELIFSPTPMALTPFGAVTPIINGAAPRTNIRILIHDGTRTCTPYNIYDYGTTGQTNLTTYPMVHHMNDPFNATFDINFAVCDFYYYESIGLTNSNLFNNYWRRTLNQINSGKMLTAYFDLREDDIKTLKLNDKIRIDNSWWSINKVQDYNCSQRMLTKVELLSIDDELKIPIARRTVKRPTGNITAIALEAVKERFYKNNNVNLSEGGVVLKGIGNVVNEGLTGFVQGDYKVITETSPTDSPKSYKVLPTITYAVQAGDYGFITTAATIITLPSASVGVGTEYILKNVSAGTARFQPSGGELIEGGANLLVPTGQAVTVVSDGSQWWAISKY